jgi:polyhydroxyalkanoate synthesis regulator phasin
MLLTDWRLADFDELLKSGWPGVDPRQTVLLKKPPAGFSRSAAVGMGGSARLLRYANTEVVVEVVAPGGGILLLNDVWHPWWHASVDGTDREILKAQKLRTEWAKDLAAFQVLMQSAWNEAVQRFLREVNDTQGAPITTWRELTDVWVKVANETLLATHRTPEFLEAQRHLTRSGAECRLQERAVAEVFCEMQQTPTRTEMDEVQREVYELRRRLRALEKRGAPAAVPSIPSSIATRTPRRGAPPVSPKATA